MPLTLSPYLSNDDVCRRVPSLLVLLVGFPDVGGVFSSLLGSFGSWLVEMASSSWFLVEAKSFKFVWVEGVSDLRVYKRSRGLIRSIAMGKATMSRLLDTMKALLHAESSKEFVKSSWVGANAFIAQRGPNRCSRFVSIDVTFFGLQLNFLSTHTSF
jgi:hypothetical protein